MTLDSFLLEHADTIRQRPRIRDGRLRLVASREAADVWRDFPLDEPVRCLEVAARYERSRDKFLRAAAAVAKEHAEGTSPETVLIRRLRCRRSDDRHAAAVLLAYIGTSRATAELCLRLRDGAPKVQCGAAFALGEIGDVRAIPPLLHLLRKCVGRRSLRFRHYALYSCFALLLSGVFLRWTPEVFGSGVSLAFGLTMWVGLIYGAIGTMGMDRANRILPEVSYALTKLGDFKHVPELRETSAELRAVAETKFYTVQNREISKNLADFIDRTLDQQTQLPIPATAVSDQEHLPIASTNPEAPPSARQVP